MRAINDILRGVILELESIGRAPHWPWEDFESKSPLGLYMSSPTGDPQTPVLWSPDLDADTGTLIDAAPSAGLQVVVSKEGRAYVFRRRGRAGAIASASTESTREAVILALAKALGVETEE